MPDSGLKVLMIEDSCAEAILLQEALLQVATGRFHISWATNLAKAEEALKAESFDVILLDLSLPDSRGLATVERVLPLAGAIPMIVFTGLEDEELALAAIRQGAQDYLVKGKVDGPTVSRAIRYAIDRKRAEEEIRRARDELEVRVKERTADLESTVNDLQDEVLRRISAEGELRQRTAQLRALASELTLVEQRERRRMAEVLHDHLQQLLVGARFRLRSLQRTCDGELREAAIEVDNLIGECINVSRSLTGELSPPILHEGGLVPALEWLVRWMENKHGLAVTLEVADPVAPRSEDITVLLFQSVRELLFNAAKHSRVGQAVVQVSRHDDSVRIVVRDEGAGFDPGVIRAAGGSEGGFGLFSIRERLDLLGGSMEIDSAPGKGSRFSLWAPLGAPEPSPPAEPAWPPFPLKLCDEAPPAADSPGGSRKIRVLIADDHAIVRQGLSQLLGAEPDIEVVGEVADGEMAIQAARTLRPDVVIMDVSMPRLGGVEATRQILADLPGTFVIALSMFEEEEKAEAVLAAGAVQFLSKTGPAGTLLAAIRKCAAGSAPPGSPPASTPAQPATLHPTPSPPHRARPRRAPAPRKKD